MFFLRCAFWLMIVYASMSWPNDALVSVRPQIARPVAATLDTVIAGVGDLCRRQPARCLADAAKLTAIIDAGDGGDDARPEAPATTVEPADVPLPVPDPRRHARTSLLTRLP